MGSGLVRFDDEERRALMAVLALYTGKRLTGNMPARRSVRPSGGGITKAVWFRLITETSGDSGYSSDFTTCQSIDPNDFGKLAPEETRKIVRIAKPSELRPSEYEGKTINGIRYERSQAGQRTATIPADPETEEEIQIVVPAYVPGDEDNGYLGSAILAVKMKGTGIVYGDDDEPVVWQEINQGRAWAQLTAEFTIAP